MQAPANYRIMDIIQDITFSISVIAMKGDVMMRKRIFGIWLIMLCLALLPACLNENVDSNDMTPVLDLSSAEKLTFKPASKDDFSVKVYDIDVPEGWSVGGVFPYNSM
jgi:curli biogenesis system outer membrane secretion channel CsgG